MNVLIYGGNGWIGAMFVKEYSRRYSSATITISPTKVNSSNVKTLEEEIARVDRVVCTLGRTSGPAKDGGAFINTIDYLEDHLNENVRDNLWAPVTLAKICARLEKPFFYLGTGCIFSWDTVTDTERRVVEEDRPDFFGSGYSIVKGYTDDLMKLFSNVCNWRIRMPIVNYPHPKNFISKIASYSLINNNNNSMTYLPHLIPVMVEMTFKNAKGTFNMTNAGYSSHTAILDLYKAKVDPSHSYHLATGEKDLNLASKRSSNILSTNKLAKWCKLEGVPVPPSIQECLEECFQTWTGEGPQNPSLERVPSA